ncbi:MAG TPA: SusD/RagB family nutrient-binding outer membrane lipoprotein [Puia sp.]|nr:SusD/RagB family nutrient-binding outer membrane lipoprotein [Puia sp.]
MKHINIKSLVLFALAPVLLFSCKKFADVNNNPVAANSNQVQVEYFIDNSIVTAQMNPGVSERAFILYWAAAGHQISDADGATFSWGAYSDEWISEYYNNQASALTYINNAITIGNQQIAAGTQKLYTQNLIWISRIWCAYLLTEMSDCFGPMPTNGFQGVNPSFSDVKTVYYYALSELDSASAGINPNVETASATLASDDPAYGFNWLNWQQYANSLRLRLAMRLSQVDPTKAQSEFEAAAATKNFITSNSANFGVKEAAGWNSLSGVYTRCWYLAPESVALNNLMVNLGGVTTASQLPSVVSDPTSLTTALGKVKAANYIGQYLPVQFTTMTNNPYSAYYMDGMPATIDPRAFQMFYIPGNSSSPTFPSGTCGAIDGGTTDSFRNIDGTALKAFNAAFTWNPMPDGNWGAKGGVVNTLNSIVNIGASDGKVPSLQQKFRTQTATRVFFGAWETYFLLAEGGVRGWATPVPPQAAYDSGISQSFAYWGVSNYLASYLANDDYNRNGTCVDWNNTTEPSATFTASYVDGVTNTPGTKSITYPVNTLYQGGAVRNDQLTKIITQKFIAQTPWLPIETWSDHRRLGLPFFDNPVLEAPIQTLPTLTSSNVTSTSSQQFFPQRMKYPASLQNSNVNGYNAAISALGGQDAVLTPLWWAQH